MSNTLTFLLWAVAISVGVSVGHYFFEAPIMGLFAAIVAVASLDRIASRRKISRRKL
jgi:hypothetical protein